LLRDPSFSLSDPSFSLSDLSFSLSDLSFSLSDLFRHGAALARGDRLRLSNEPRRATTGVKRRQVDAIVTC
jgi:hypothetical protein